MNSYAPAQNIAALTRKTKGPIKLFGGLVAPFYWTDVVVAEGTPMIPVAGTQDKVIRSAGGDAKDVIGLSTQMTYDEAAFGQLKGYHFANDTRARLGQPIGILMGTGFALTNFYVGATTYGAPCYLNLVVSGGATGPGGTAATAADIGKLKVTGIAADKLPIVFEGVGDSAAAAGPVLVRIRYNFAPNVAVAV